MRFGKVAVAVAVACVVGCLGLAPHVAYSLEEQDLTWFYSSYDEGFYGWAAIHGQIGHRLLTGVIMRMLTLISFQSVEGAMIIADGLFPFLSALAAFFLAAAVTRSRSGMIFGGLFLLMASELLSFRSTYSPTASLLPIYEAVTGAIDSRPEGLFPEGNQTSVFWLFRTPEPQISWILAFVALGSVLRVVNGTTRWMISVYAITCAALGAGYLLVALPILGALCFVGLSIAFIDRRTGLTVLVPAAIGGAIAFGLAFASAAEGGSSSLVFASRLPALLPSGLIGLAVAMLAGILQLRGGLDLRRWILISCLAASPLLMANQQVLTGRMIYLFNFENFAFCQLVAVSLILLVSMVPHLLRGREFPVNRWLTRAAATALLVILGLSQAYGYRAYLATNRDLQRYADAVESAEVDRETPILCTDIFVADTLAIPLGWRPNYLLARDMTFERLVDRLGPLGEAPPQRQDLQPRLFETLALQGVSPDEFDAMYEAVVDPTSTDWKGRFFVGGFLYHPADFWGPLTHHRSTRLDLIRNERPAMIEAYRRYFESKVWPSREVIVVGPWKHDDLKAARESFRIRRLGANPEAGTGRIRAVKIIDRQVD